MKTKALYLLISLSLGSSASGFAQSNYCTASQKLICQFPVSGSLLSQLTFGQTGPVATAAVNAAFSAATSVNAAVAAQLTQLPVPSAAIGIIQIRKKDGEVPTPFNNLGPILTDRPDTVGRGHVFIGAAYQHFNFNTLDGFKLSALPIAFSYQDDPSTPSPKIHYGSMRNIIGLQLDQYIFVATAGVSPSTDLSVLVPVNRVSVNVITLNFTAFDYDLRSGSYSAHNPPAGTSLTSHGTSSGVGDVTLGIKQMLVGQDHNRPAAAIGATFRIPTGDAFNYLGSGTLGGSLFGLIEFRAKFAPHAKVGYQWNDSTKVLSPNLQGSGARLPGGLQYAVGTDYRAQKRLTLSADLLGSQFVNTPYFAKNTYLLNPPPDTPGVPTSYDIVAPINNTYTTVNFSGGIKYSPFGSLLLYGNALIQLNNVGLRAAEVVPLAGIAYNFSRKRE